MGKAKKRWHGAEILFELFDLEEFEVENNLDFTVSAISKLDSPPGAARNGYEILRVRKKIILPFETTSGHLSIGCETARALRLVSRSATKPGFRSELSATENYLRFYFDLIFPELDVVLSAAVLPGLEGTARF